MSLLREMLEDVKLLNLAEQMDAMEASLAEFKLIVNEAMIGDSNGPLEAEFDEVEKRLLAARRAMGIANRIADPEEKKRHKGNVMQKFNALQKQFRDIMIKMNFSREQINNELQRVRGQSADNRDMYGNVGQGLQGRQRVDQEQKPGYSHDQEHVRKDMPAIHRKRPQEPHQPPMPRREVEPVNQAKTKRWWER
ncbi:MAG: hypothetical protein ABIR91_00295 [Candidatus Saccharimonadales bacterium]